MTIRAPRPIPIRRQVRVRHWASAIAALALSTPAGNALAGSSYAVLHQFNQSIDGANPAAPLTLRNGVLYGTTSAGGGIGFVGTVFSLTPPTPPATKWTYQVLHRFDQNTSSTPMGGVVFGQDGSLYGTTYEVGREGGCRAVGTGAQCGTVYRLTRPASGLPPWTYEVLHTFSGGADGAGPRGALAVNRTTGEIYGASEFGGNGIGSAECRSFTTIFGCGTIFRLTPPVAGKAAWTYAVIKRLQGGSEGWGPRGGVALQDGAIYATTHGGGSLNEGVIVSLTAPAATLPDLSSGVPQWVLQVVHTFTGGVKGSAPAGKVLFNATGNLLALFEKNGVSFNKGGIIELRRKTAKTEWEKVSEADEDSYPQDHVNLRGFNRMIGLQAGLVSYSAAAAADLSAGSTAGGELLAFSEVTGIATWTRIVLHKFVKGSSSGSNPQDAPVSDAGGVLYGATVAGGIKNGGVIYKLVP
jgi:hypothetical protein